MRQIPISFVFLLLFFTAKSHAQDVIVRVPQNPIPSLQETTQKALAETKQDPYLLEVGVSSWAPHQLKLESFVANASAFERGPLPTVSVNLLFPSPLLRSPSWGTLTPEVGSSILQMTRTGLLRYSGFEEPVEQNLILIPLRIGGRFNPTVLNWRRLEPYFGLKLLPTFAFSPKSALSDGDPTFGIPLELSLGTSIHLREIEAWLGSPNTVLDLGLVSTFGTLTTINTSGDLFGFGVFLGLRWI